MDLVGIHIGSMFDRSDYSRLSNNLVFHYYLHSENCHPGNSSSIIIMTLFRVKSLQFYFNSSIKMIIKGVLMYDGQVDFNIVKPTTV